MQLVLAQLYQLSQRLGSRSRLESFVLSIILSLVPTTDPISLLRDSENDNVKKECTGKHCEESAREEYAALQLH